MGTRKEIYLEGTLVFLETQSIVFPQDSPQSHGLGGCLAHTRTFLNKSCHIPIRRLQEAC